MELLQLTDGEFKEMAKLVYDRTGIYLPEEKKSLLSNRLRKRLRALSLDDFQAYYNLLKDRTKCEDELPHFLSAVTTNETYFFRNDELWKYLRKEWIPEAVARKEKQKSIRIWSAASSTGAEAYTTAICLLECIPNAKQWRIEVIGSDISDRVLQQARDGVYDNYAVARVDPVTVKRWFTQADGKFHVTDEVKKIVSFRFHNLRDKWPQTAFDLIFLRNVLMYFDMDMKLRVLENATNALQKDGQLIVGDVDPIRSTPLLNKTVKLEYVRPNVYRRPASTAAETPGLLTQKA